MTSDRFTVELTRAAERDLRRLGGGPARATQALLVLEEDPYRGHTLTGTLSGVRSLEFSLPGGAYRAAYVVLEMEQTCLVFMVGPHENFYREAARRYAALRRAGHV
jgi:mRNA interferase RelE/StbE